MATTPFSDFYPSRLKDCVNFLAQAGLKEAEITFLAGDCSFRRYYRLIHQGASFVLMDAPPTKESIVSFCLISDILSLLQAAVPRIIARDEALGFLILEDFGDHTFTVCLSNGHDETTLYKLAFEKLQYIHRQCAEITLPDLPLYTDDLYVAEALLLPQWFAPYITGLPSTQTALASYEVAWREVLLQIPPTPPTLVLRDFHVDNMMYLNERNDLKRCGLLDFQDAVMGHPAYDIVSLFEDARRDVNPHVVHTLLESAGYLRDDDFMKAYTILGAQRACKIAGIFVRLMQRDHKDATMKHLPRVWGMVKEKLENPLLVPIKNWFDTHCPDWPTWTVS